MEFAIPGSATSSSEDWYQRSSQAHRPRSIMSSDTMTLREEETQGFSDTKHKSYFVEKSLPQLPPPEEHTGWSLKSQDSAPSSFSHTSPTPAYPGVQLANALGPDNITHTTEIDSIPCSGIAISSGPLEGLLGWRLVVRPPPGNTTGRQRFDSLPSARIRPYSAFIPQSAPIVASHSRSFPDALGALDPLAPSSIGVYNPALRGSTYSLPSNNRGHRGIQDSPYSSSRTGSVDLYRRPATANRPTLQPSRMAEPVAPPKAIVVNFLLNTGSPHSFISRDALVALGYPSHVVPASTSSHNNRPGQTKGTITLIVQNIPTSFLIAQSGEASCLGVQFLRDAGVSVFYPRGAGVPILYVESEQDLTDIPVTVPRTSGCGRLTLAQRVRILLGFNHP